MLAQNVSVPLTPCSVTSEEEHLLPVHVTPDLQEIDREGGPKTPHKESTTKKKVGKAGSKRKLFLQTSGLNTVSKAKKLSSPQNTKPKKYPCRTASVRETARSNFPQTERQQLQYLLEVTAKDAKSSSDLGTKETVCANFTKVRRKDAGRDNSITTRILRRNERGETALHVAAIKGDLEDLVTLIEAGADVNAKDNAGWSPLHEACNYGHQKIVEKLVDAGADVNVPGYEAITPLHDAVVNDHAKVVQFLLLHGADPRQATNQGYIAADLAKSSAVRESLRQFAVLRYTTTQGNDRRNVGGEQDEIENELNMGSHGSLAHNKRYFQECFKDCETEVEHLSLSNWSPKPVEPVCSLQSPDLTPANVLENDVTIQSPMPKHKQNFDEEIRGFDTDTATDQRATPLFTDAPTNDAGHTSYLNGYSSKESLQMPFRLEERENMCYASSTGDICSGRVGDSCSILLAGKTGLGSPTKDHSEDLSGNAATETSDIHVNLDTVQSDLPVFEHDKKCCTYTDAQDQESAGSVALEEQEIRQGYPSQQENGGTTNTSHTDVKPRVSQSVTEPHASVRSTQKKRSTRSSGSSRSKYSTSSSTSDAATEPGSCEARALKEYDEVTERGELGVCLNHTANKTWRATVDNQRYKASLPPVCVPGYEDFLLHTRSYSLSGSTTATQQNSSVCQDSVRSSDNKAKEMKIRQRVEKEKLRLSLEQELVRVFGNVARTRVGYDSPYAACAIIQAQMLSDHSEAIQAPNLSTKRSLRAEVGAVLSKFEKLNGEACRRHRHEVDALLALSQLDEGFGEAKVVQQEMTSGTCQHSFELVPHKFREYYEKVLCFSE